ncbi:MAG: AAA family ATPase [Candidatus Bathyarchaeia archaeon]
MENLKAMSLIFKDRDKLLPNFPIERYWNSLPHRERQLALLRSFYWDILDRRGESFLRVCQAIGPAGTGKTSTLRLFGDSFAKEAHSRRIDIDHIYINLKMEGGRKVVLYRNLLGKVEPALVSASLSAEEMLKSLVIYLQERKRKLLLTIDEIDYYVKHFKDEGAVYDLTRLNELIPGRPCGVVGVTFVAREDKFHELLEKAELSSLGRNYIEFQPYTSSQVYDIIDRRAREALRPGVCSDEVLEFIANVTSSPPANGDLRYALDLLLYAGNLAESQGSSVILPEHVRRVHSTTYPAITDEDLISLPDEEKLVLMSIARTLRQRRSPYASLREIRSMVGVVREELGLNIREDIEDYVQDLADRNIIEIRSLKQIGISGLALDDLDRFLNSLIERILRT